VSNYVSEAPLSTLCDERRGASFDDLVGQCEQLGRYNEAKRLRGLKIDHQLEFGRLLDRQIAGFFALENATGVKSNLSVMLDRLTP
jgi:hypothetical protein